MLASLHDVHEEQSRANEDWRYSLLNVRTSGTNLALNIEGLAHSHTRIIFIKSTAPSYSIVERDGQFIYELVFNFKSTVKLFSVYIHIII